MLFKTDFMFMIKVWAIKERGGKMSFIENKYFTLILISIFIFGFVFFTGCKIEKGRVNVIDINKIKEDMKLPEKTEPSNKEVDVVSDIKSDLESDKKTVTQPVDIAKDIKTQPIESEKDVKIEDNKTETKPTVALSNVKLVAVKGKDYDYELRAKETDLIKLDVVVDDPDKDKITLTYSSPLSADGTWQTKEGDAGEYMVEVKASDGKLTDKKKIKLFIDVLNHAPTIEIKENFTFREGEKIVLKPKVSDQDGDKVTVTYSGFMNSDIKEIQYNESGKHKVIITASDGKKISEKVINIEVIDKNRAPVIRLDNDTITVTETELAKIAYVIEDPDKDDLSVKFSEPFNEKGEWQTKEGDAGRYNISINASDGKTSVKEFVKLIVNKLNHAPEFVASSLNNVIVEEGDLIVLSPQVKDKDNDSITITYSGWMKTSKYQTTFEDAGTYNVTVTASDGKLKIEKTITVTVKNVNRAPVIKEIKLLAR